MRIHTQSKKNNLNRTEGYTHFNPNGIRSYVQYIQFIILTIQIPWLSFQVNYIVFHSMNMLYFLNKFLTNKHFKKNSYFQLLLQLKTWQCMPEFVCLFGYVKEHIRIHYQKCEWLLGSINFYSYLQGGERPHPRTLVSCREPC